MADQPRWPRGTPWRERGPGPGRWRDDGKPNKPRPSWEEVAPRVTGRKGWMQRLSDMLGRRRGASPTSGDDMVDGSTPAGDHTAAGDDGSSSAYRPRTLPDGSADPDNQEAWEDEVKQILDDRGYDPDQAEIEFEGFGSEYFDWHDDPAGFVDYVIEEISGEADSDDGDGAAQAAAQMLGLGMFGGGGSGGRAYSSPEAWGARVEELELSTQPSADELQAISNLSNMAGPGGWVDVAAFRGLFRPNELDSLVRKGWVERSGDRYRVDPRGMEGRSGPTESGALVGDVYPADPLVRRVDTGGPETIEGDWADRAASRMVGAADDDNPSHSQIMQALSRAVADNPRLSSRIGADDLGKLTPEIIAEVVEQARVDRHNAEGGDIEGSFTDFVVDQLAEMLRSFSPEELWPHHFED